MDWRGLLMLQPRLGVMLIIPRCDMYASIGRFDARRQDKIVLRTFETKPFERAAREETPRAVHAASPLIHFI